MPLKQDLTASIPYLRRFARALTGSQGAGDGLVLATLERLAADQDAIASAQNTRLALYKAFLTVWDPDSPRQNFTSAASAEEQPVRKNLGAMEPWSRAAFLLVMLEGFPLSDVAAILGRSAEDTSALLASAERDAATQMRTRVLIIEDEPFIALDLQTLVEDLGHTVIGNPRTHDEAIAAVRNQKPGLILADIQLADGSSGLEAVNEILGALPVPVIFITAFPERYLTGKASEPAFLVTKPFQRDSLKALISQALFFDRRSRP